MHQARLIRISDAKNTEKDFNERLFRTPISLTYSINNLRLRCAYARYLKEYKKTGVLPLVESLQKMTERLKSAPELFQAKNKPTYRILNNSSKTRE